MSPILMLAAMFPSVRKKHERRGPKGGHTQMVPERQLREAVACQERATPIPPRER